MNARFERCRPDYRDFPAKLIWHPAENRMGVTYDDSDRASCHERGRQLSRSEI